MQILMFCYYRQKWTLTYYLHDAVYLYLLTVHQTLAEGNVDYRNGRLIRNMTIGQRFTGERVNNKMTFYVHIILLVLQ